MENIGNITRIFLNSLPSRHRLSFGVNSNVVLKAVSNDVRRNRDGLKIKKCCYLLFAKVDPEEGNKVISESEFNYFIADNIDHVKKSFTHQFTQLSEILTAVAPAAEGRAARKLFNKKIKAVVPILYAVLDGSITKEMIPRVVEAQELFINSFITVITPYLDDKSDLLDLMVVKDKSGKYNNLPREDKGFISKTSANKKMVVPDVYVQYFNGRNAKTTDVNDNIGSEEIMDETEILAGDDVVLLEDI